MAQWRYEECVLHVAAVVSLALSAIASDYGRQSKPQRFGTPGIHLFKCLTGKALIFLQLCGDWHDPVPLMIQITELEFITGYPAFDCVPLEPDSVRQVCGCEDGCAALCSSNCRLSRVTIIGDAAHPMSPFKGQGANQALIDGVSLARALHQSSIGFETEKIGISLGAAAPRYSLHDHTASDFNQPLAYSVSQISASEVHVSNFGPPVTEILQDTSLAQALQVFEKNMLARSTVKARASNDAVAVLHSKGAFSAALDVLSSHFHPQKAF